MQLSAEKIWNSAQEQLRSKLSRDTYNMWFAPLRASAIDGSHVTLEAPNEFCEVWLKDNYISLLQDAVAIAAGKQLQIKFKISATPTAAPVSAPTRATTKAKTSESAHERASVNGDNSFNPKNTFETFVVGNNNNFAYAAALAVAQAPGKSYNPLFLYGGVGLGKTHLLHAIGQHVAANKKGARVAYLSSEKFTNEYIDAIQNNKLAAVPQKTPAEPTCCWIDDIQFLAGKERIQEEFFHTFNALHESHRQIVLTCDRPASEIQNLEHRLVSRFEWGLVTDMQPPDYHRRCASQILQVAEESAIHGQVTPVGRRHQFPGQPHPHQRPPPGRRAYPRCVLRPLAHREKVEHRSRRKTCSAKFSTEEGLSSPVHQRRSHPKKKVAEHFDIRLADMTSPANAARKTSLSRARSPCISRAR